MSQRSDRSHPSSPAYTPTGFFALRTPLLPFRELIAWSEGLTAPTALPESLPHALAADRARLSARLRELLKGREIREAIFLASPSLDERMPEWLQAVESDPKIERILTRYFTRMAARCTPFGLFAGCSVGTVGRSTRLRICAREGCRPHRRLDMDFLFALVSAAVRLPTLRASIRYRPADDLYQAQGRLRHAAVRLEEQGRKYELVLVEPTDYLEQTLARAREGALLESLAEALVDDEISREEADAYIAELVDSQLLVPELAPFVTGPEPTEILAAELRQHGEKKIAEPLDAANFALRDLDEAGLGADPARYRAIARSLEDLPARPEIARLFQVDLIRPSESAELGPGVLRTLLQGMELLHRLGPARDPLDAFKEAFVQRYGDEEIPLSEALDEESGIGFQMSNAASSFAEPLLEGLPFPSSPSSAAQDVPWGAREQLLLSLLDKARLARAHVLTLDDRDLDAFATPSPLPLPDALAVMATLAAPSEEALARGDFSVLLRGALGAPGATFLGRFCHADPELRAWVERHLREEESRRPDAIFAEIVHLPEGRVGNVLLRPVLRAHEIPFLGRSGAPSEGQIRVADLVLRITGGRIVLRSRRLGREVLPRLTTAHNHASIRNLGVYRFLCALQHQGVCPYLGFSWGPLETAPFLPRLVHGRIVLCRARWLLGREPLEPLGKARDDTARFTAMQRLRAELDLPRFVSLADGDNELPIDLDNVLAVDTLVHLLKGRREARLVELFPGPDVLCASGPDGTYAHEIIVPFVRKMETPAQTRAAPPFPTPPTRAQRLFPPGSSWLFVKLYTGLSMADRLLGKLITPIASRALASGAADAWFFIRYGDPEAHLRFRLHGDPGRVWGEVFPELERTLRPYFDDGSVRKIVLEPYEREVDRYGGVDGIELAERIFFADSEAVAAIVALLLEAGGAADARWRIALAGVDRLLGDMGMDTAEKHAVMAMAREGYGRHLSVNTALARKLGERYRVERTALEPLLDPQNDETSEFAPALEILRRRSERLVPVMQDFLARERAGRLSRPRADIAISLIHMFTNRFFRSATNAQEVVIYDLLLRLYASRLARKPR